MFLLFTYTLPIIYSNTYKYSSDTRFLKGIPRMSNNMLVLRSLNKTKGFHEKIESTEVFGFRVGTDHLGQFYSQIFETDQLVPEGFFFKKTNSVSRE